MDHQKGFYTSNIFFILELLYSLLEMGSIDPDHIKRFLDSETAVNSGEQTKKGLEMLI